MSNDTVVLKGVVHGTTIQLERESGLPDGEAVRLEIRPLGPAAGWLDRIVVAPAGRPVIKGTLIPAEDVARLLDQGRTAAEIRQAYPDLTEEDLEAVRQYACVPPGLRRSFGAWAEDEEELDEYLEWNRRQRKVGRREVEG